MKKVWLILISVLMISSVYAVSPFQETGNTDYLQILTPAFDTLKQGQDREFHWHVYNQSDYLTNDTTNCSFHLYSRMDEGEHIYVERDVRTFVEHRDFEVFINGSNFTKVGDYSVLIECFSPIGIKATSGIVGALEFSFKVTPTGFRSDLKVIIIPICFLVISILIFLIGLTFDNEKYIIKSSFYLISVLFCLVTIGTIKLINYESTDLINMFLMAFIVLLSVILFIFLLTFVLFTIQTIKSFKKKEGIRWDY